MSFWGYAWCKKNQHFIAIGFFSSNVTSKLGIFKNFMANKINIKKRNFQVLVFKSRRSLWGNAWCHKKINFCHSFFSSNVTSKLRVFDIFKANQINIKRSLQKRNFKVLFFESQRSLWGHAWCLKKIYWLLKVFAWIFHLNWKKIFQVTQWPQNSLIKSSRYLWDTL